jgi:predicted aconitase
MVRFLGLVFGLAFSCFPLLQNDARILAGTKERSNGKLFRVYECNERKGIELSNAMQRMQASTQSTCTPYDTSKKNDDEINGNLG